MITRIICAAIFMLWLVLMHGAHLAVASIHGSSGGGGGLCPQGSGYPNDGCTGAPAAGANTVQYSNFFTSRALQSSQTYGNKTGNTGCASASSCRPPWNVAGVDYPVGIPNGTTLKDPANIHTDQASCTYNAGTFTVTCDGISGGGVTINGYDFSLHNCVFLDIYRYSGTITIENSNFATGSNGVCYSGGGNSLVNIDSPANTGDLIVRNNVFNGNAPTYATAAGFTMILDNYRTSGATTYQYNAFLQVIGRAFATHAPGLMTAQFNYIEGLNYHGGIAHGEIQAYQASSLTQNTTINFNAFLLPNNYSGGMTSTWYISGGAGLTNTLGFATVNIEYNVAVTNLYASGNCDSFSSSTCSSGALAEFAYSPVTTANIISNYVDPTGALTCISNVGGGSGSPITNLTQTGNIDMLNGSSISDMTTATCYGHGHS